MAKKKGERFQCDECGLVVLVEDPCGCGSCELVCCGEAMKLAKAAVAPKKKVSKPKKK